MKNAFYIVIIFFSLASCKKDAGVSGKKQISGTVYYKTGASSTNLIADNAIVKIAYGANVATTNFDQTLLTNANGEYEISGLRKGNYYITAEYTDSNGFKYVTNGFIVTLKNKKSELVLDIILE